MHSIIVMVSAPFFVFQIDDDMTAKLDLCHTRFSFMENELVYTPNWMAPEGTVYTYMYMYQPYKIHAYVRYSLDFLVEES